MSPKALPNGPLDKPLQISHVCDPSKELPGIVNSAVDHLVHEWAAVARAILMRRKNRE